MAASVKQELHQLADTLPDNATWDDVIIREKGTEGLNFNQLPSYKFLCYRISFPIP